MKIGYSKTYQLFQGGAFEKIWLEDEIESSDPEEVRKAQYSLKKQVEIFHYESNKAAEKKEQEIVKEHPLLSRTEAIIKDISTVTDLKVLESYKLIAAKDILIQDAYNKKINELKK